MAFASIGTIVDRREFEIDIPYGFQMGTEIT